jgi:hypothetical protein
MCYSIGAHFAEHKAWITGSHVNQFQDKRKPPGLAAAVTGLGWDGFVQPY